MHRRHPDAEPPGRLGRAAGGLGDALVVTGAATGEPPGPGRLREVREASPGPLLLGSGLDPDRAAELLPLVDGAIVGTWLKEQGDVSRPVDVERVRRLRAAFDRT